MDPVNDRFGQGARLSAAASAAQLAAAWSALQAGDWRKTELILRELLQAQDAPSDAWYLLGVVQQTQARSGEAVASYREALRLNPNMPEALNNLGLALLNQGVLDEAEACLRQALALRPDYADALNNLGNACQDRGRPDEAEVCYRRAVALKPGMLDALHNLGNALRAQGKGPEALASYDAVLRLDSNHAQAHVSRALLWIQQGDFARGWPEFEWRWKCADAPPRPFSQPMWDGRPLHGQTILLYVDYGFGDTLQFIRYAPMVANRGGRVAVACQRPLARLLTSAPGVDRVIAEGEPLPEFSVYAPLMSLPAIFRTTLANIPARIPYLATEPQLLADWAKRLAGFRELQIGVAWQGNPRYRRDRQRSFRLAQLEPLARTEGVRLISLQKGPGTEQLDEVAGRFDVSVLNMTCDDLTETAAVLQNLDLVITPDSSFAHLAGALGVPVWVALSFAPEARWLEAREDSPWYPSMRLFRQPVWGEWDDVFARMAAALAGHVGVAL